MKQIYSLIFILGFLAFSIVSCGESPATTKPTMSLVDSKYVTFNDKKVKITSLERVLKEHKMKLAPEIRDSIQIQFELHRGIDKEVLQLVKEEIKNAGILDLKFVAPF